MSDTSNSEQSILSRFEALNAPGDGKRRDEDTADTGDTSDDDAIQAAFLAAEGGDDEGAEDGSDDGADGEDDAHEDDAPPEPKARRLRVKVDGKELEVDEAEVIAGYQRNADYTRKTQEAAALRKAADAERAQAAQERARYTQGLQAILPMLQEPQIDWAELERTDPVGYVSARAQQMERAQARAAAQAEFQRMQHIQQQEQATAHKAMIDAESAKLPDLIPNFPKEKDKQTALLKDVRNYGLSIGFTQEDMSQIYQAGAVAVLHKAMKYDEMVARAKTARPTVSAVAPAARPSRTRPSEDQVARQKLKKSGRLDDATDAMMAFASLPRR